MTLWRGDAYESHGFYPCESAFQRRDEWKALPAASYAALLARLAAAEALLREARYWMDAPHFATTVEQRARAASRIDAALKRDGEGT